MRAAKMRGAGANFQNEPLFSLLPFDALRCTQKNALSTIGALAFGRAMVQKSYIGSSCLIREKRQRRTADRIAKKNTLFAIRCEEHFFAEFSLLIKNWINNYRK